MTPRKTTPSERRKLSEPIKLFCPICTNTQTHPARDWHSCYYHHLGCFVVPCPSCRRRDSKTPGYLTDYGVTFPWNH